MLQLVDLIQLFDVAVEEDALHADDRVQGDQRHLGDDVVDQYENEVLGDHRKEADNVEQREERGEDDENDNFLQKNGKLV